MATKKQPKKNQRVARDLTSDQIELLESHGFEQVSGGSGEAWSEGVKVRGIFGGFVETTFEQDDGEFAKNVQIETGTGVRMFRAPAVLQNRLATVNEGDEVFITCNGKIRTNAGRQAWDFTVLVKRNTPAKIVSVEPKTTKKAARTKKRGN
jgi:hypothetical protein